MEEVFSQASSAPSTLSTALKQQSQRAVPIRDSREDGEPWGGAWGRCAAGSRQTRDSFPPALTSPAAGLGFFTDFVEVALLEAHPFP